MKKLSNEEIRARINEFQKGGVPGKTLEFSVKSGGWIWQGMGLDNRGLAHRLAEWIPAQEQRISQILTNMGEEQDLLAKSELQKWVKERKQLGIDDRPMRHWLALVTGFSGETASAQERLLFESYFWAVKQWIWLTLRNILGEKVAYHTCLVFWSRAQATGKTSSVEKLLKPLANWTRPMALYEISADFMARILGRTYVAIFDELAGAEKASRASLKAKITATENAGRGIRTDSAASTPAVCSFIATTNEAPPHGLDDESGGRRYSPIQFCSVPLDRDPARAEALDEFNYEDIWRCVSWDETPCPHLQTPPAISNFWSAFRDDTFRRRTPIETFLEEEMEDDDYADSYLHIRFVVDAYTSFVKSDHGQRTKRTPIKQMKRLLEERGITVTDRSNHFYLRGKRFISQPVDPGNALKHIGGLRPHPTRAPTRYTEKKLG